MFGIFLNRQMRTYVYPLYVIYLIDQSRSQDALDLVAYFVAGILKSCSNQTFKLLFSFQ